MTKEKKLGKVELLNGRKATVPSRVQRAETAPERSMI